MKHLMLITAALLASAGSIGNAQSVLYRETFGRPDPATGNLNTPLFDWQRFQPTGALAGGGGVSSDSTGKPIDLPQTTTAGPVQDGTFNAYAEGWSYMDGTHRLSMTTEYSFNPADAAPVTFKWWQGANNAAGGGLNDGRLAVRIGTQWYVTSQIFVNVPSVPAGTAFGNPETDPVAPGASPMSFAWDPSPAKWLLLTFDGNYILGATPGTGTGVASTVPMSVGSNPGSPLSGTITAFGLYRDVSGQNFRFDNFTIEGDGPTPGDVDGDDDVDMEDFAIIRDNFQKSVAGRQFGDLDGSTVVDFIDFRQWKTNFPFPSEAASAAIPEPAGMMMAVFGIAAAAALRRP
jgi:hypothetical protein